MTSSGHSFSAWKIISLGVKIFLKSSFIFDDFIDKETRSFPGNKMEVVFIAFFQESVSVLM